MSIKKKSKLKVIITRSTPVAPDPRIERMIFAMKEIVDINVLGFNREFNFPVYQKEGEYFIFRIDLPKVFKKKQKNKLVINALKLFYFNLKEFFWLMKNDFDIVHACDFDTYIPALMAVKIKRKKIVYDIFDFYADMLVAKPNFIKKIIRGLDLFLMKYADVVIIADDSRREQIKAERLKRVLTIYNSPPDLLSEFQKIPVRKKDKIILAYFGGLDNRQRNLETIINVIENNDIVNLVIAGDGVDREYIIEKARTLSNVEYLGMLPYKKALEEEYKSDIMLAIYDPKIPNNMYASPNKLFEAMMLGKPILMNQEIKCAEIVKKYNCGLLFKYDNPVSFKSALNKFLENPELREVMGKNARIAYEKSFSFTNVKNTLLTIYKDFCKV